MGKPVRIDWDGEQKRDYVYVRDIARSNLLALTQGSGEAYCIATGRGTSVNALYRRLVELTGTIVEGEGLHILVSGERSVKLVNWIGPVDQHDLIVIGRVLFDEKRNELYIDTGVDPAC